MPKPFTKADIPKLIAIVIALLFLITVGISQLIEEKRTPEVKRKQEIFQALVELQGATDPEKDSGTYKIIGDTYKVSEQEVRDIAIQGIQEDWPMPDSKSIKETIP
ncbi:MAG: hypothetical protein M1548_09960 [Actinobacteria bacterium]|nr:hypothetical protein [Actinomycetota bacterium]